MEQAVAFEPTDSADKSQQYCSKKREPLNDASKMFPLAHQVSPRGWSIICLKLVLIFLNSLKPSHSHPSCFPLRNFWRQKEHIARMKQNRSDDSANLQHVSCYHSSTLVMMSWRSPHNIRFSPHSDEKIGLFVNRLSTFTHLQKDVIQRMSESHKHFIEMWQSKHRIDLTKYFWVVKFPPLLSWGNRNLNAQLREK